MSKTNVTRMLDQLLDSIEGKSEREFGSMLVDIGRRFEDDVSPVWADPYLTDPGKVIRVAAIRQASESKAVKAKEAVFTKVDPLIASMQTFIRKAGNPMPERAPDPNDGYGIKGSHREQTQENRYAEIRNSFVMAGATKLVVDKTYPIADAEMRAALETGPMRLWKAHDGSTSIGRWVTEEQIDNQRMGAAMATHPEAVARLRALQSERQMAETLCNALITKMREVSPLGANDTPTFIVDGQAMTPRRPTPDA